MKSVLASTLEKWGFTASTLDYDALKEVYGHVSRRTSNLVLFSRRHAINQLQEDTTGTKQSFFTDYALCIYQGEDVYERTDPSLGALKVGIAFSDITQAFIIDSAGGPDAVRDFFSFETFFEEVYRMPEHPNGLRAYSDREIIDEDKSVRWNREEVQRRNDAYHAALIEVRRRKNACREEVYSSIKRTIAAKLKITPDKAEKILDYVRANTDVGTETIHTFLLCLDELVSLFRDVMSD